jgi:hypothetical protein
MTDSSGHYKFKGVAGVLQVQASKDGYVPATQDVSSDTEHVNLELTPGVPYAAIDGVYRLTFTSAASCRLPDEPRHHTYTATFDQVGAHATVTLTDAQGAAAVSGARGTPRVRVLAARHALPLCRAQYPDWRGVGADRAAPHQR